jgi:hypothetical protein
MVTADKNWSAVAHTCPSPGYKRKRERESTLPCRWLLDSRSLPLESSRLDRCASLRRPLSNFPSVMANYYIRVAHSPPQCPTKHKETKADHHRFPTFLIMLFHKSLISFAAAIALASSVTAVVIPASADCPSGSRLTCCDRTIAFNYLTSDQKVSLAALDHNLNIDLQVGINCALPGYLGYWVGWYCTHASLISYLTKWLTNGSKKLSFCCDSIQNQG